MRHECSSGNPRKPDAVGSGGVGRLIARTRLAGGDQTDPGRRLVDPVELPVQIANKP
jgi:hypothetical protein